MKGKKIMKVLILESGIKLFVNDELEVGKIGDFGKGKNGWLIIFVSLNLKRIFIVVSVGDDEVFD